MPRKSIQKSKLKGRTVSLYLTGGEQELFEHLERSLNLSPSDVLRFALQVATEQKEYSALIRKAVEEERRRLDEYYTASQKRLALRIANLEARRAR